MGVTTVCGRKSAVGCSTGKCGSFGMRCVMCYVATHGDKLIYTYQTIPNRFPFTTRMVSSCPRGIGWCWWKSRRMHLYKNHTAQLHQWYDVWSDEIGWRDDIRRWGLIVMLKTMHSSAMAKWCGCVNVLFIRSRVCRVVTVSSDITGNNVGRFASFNWIETI